MFLEIVFLLIDWKEALNGEGGSLRSVMRSFCRERQQIKEVSKVTTGYFWSFKRLFDGRFIHIIMKNYIYKLSISGSPPFHQFKRIKLIECCVTCILRPSSPSLWLLSEVDIVDKAGLGDFARGPFAAIRASAVTWDGTKLSISFQRKILGQNCQYLSWGKFKIFLRNWRSNLCQVAFQLSVLLL